MPITPQSIPVSNSTTMKLQLLLDGAFVEEISPLSAKTLDKTFDEIRTVAAGPGPIRTQNPNVPLSIPPGNVGSFTSAGFGFNFEWGFPVVLGNVVNFS